MIQWILALGLFGGMFGIIAYTLWEERKLGKEEAENAHLHSLNEKLSDRPITDDDLLKRLRAKAENGRRN